jgi:sensor histidine kinase YesM
MSDIAMSEPADGTYMLTNEANQLLRQLLQKIEEISNKEKETSVRIEMLETAS